MKARSILSALLVCTMLLSIMSFTAMADDSVATVGDTSYATLQSAIDAAGDGDIVTMLSNVTIAERLTITKSITLEGANKVIALDNDSRAIDIPDTANGANVTIKNLEIARGTTSWFERAINYNTTGKLVLDNVKISGATYAVNFPGSANGAVVEIKNSNLSGLNTVNIWGSDMIITITDTAIVSVDESDEEDYAAIILNSVGTTAAEGTTVTVTGGSITALDQNGEKSAAISNPFGDDAVTISDTTEVNGDVKKLVAMIGFAGYYSIYEAFEDAETGDTITLINDVYTGNNAKDCIKIEGKAITLDLNGKTLAQTITDPGLSVAAIAIRANASLTVKDSVGGGKISATTTPIQLSGTLNLESGTIACDVEPTDADKKESFLNIVWIYTADASAAPTFNMTGGSLVLGETQKSFTYKDAVYFATDITPASNYANASVSISGGSVEGTITAETLEDKVVVTGGSFTSDISAYISEGSSITENADGTFSVAENSVWTTGTDAGAYGNGIGMMRWLFAIKAEGTPSASGIKYIAGNSISSEVKGTAAGEVAKAFYGDITGIPAGTTGTYYAVAYVTIGDKTYWSKPIANTPNFGKIFENYGGAE